MHSQTAIETISDTTTYSVRPVDALFQRARPFLNVHRPSGRANVFIFSLPRSGSTWLMELVWSQPGFKCCNEPTDLRHPAVRNHLGISAWQRLYEDDADDPLREYFAGFCRGRHGFLNPRPFKRHYRPYTHRLVFKVIHGCEDRMNWFAETFNGRIVYLVRHPIAVSLSREVLPTLPALLSSSYRRHFTSEQLQFADRVNREGTRLERGVLSWCLQTSVPLRAMTDDWVVASYEQMILEPEHVVRELASRLDLPRPQRMLDQIVRPSHSSRKSDGMTRELLDTEQPTRSQRLVEKWRDQVSADEERRLMDMLARFDIDLYRAGDPLPARQLWIHEAPVRSLTPALS